MRVRKARSEGRGAGVMSRESRCEDHRGQVSWSGRSGVSIRDARFEDRGSQARRSETSGVRVREARSGAQAGQEVMVRKARSEVPVCQ